nr:hypothetical protein CFP56_78826 [Quercus suber]
MGQTMGPGRIVGGTSRVGCPRRRVTREHGREHHYSTYLTAPAMHDLEKRGAVKRIVHCALTSERASAAGTAAAAGCCADPGKVMYISLLYASETGSNTCHVILHRRARLTDTAHGRAAITLRVTSRRLASSAGDPVTPAHAAVPLPSPIVQSPVDRPGTLTTSIFASISNHASSLCTLSASPLSGSPVAACSTPSTFGTDCGGLQPAYDLAYHKQQQPRDRLHPPNSFTFNSALRPLWSSLTILRPDAVLVASSLRAPRCRSAEAGRRKQSMT